MRDKVWLAWATLRCPAEVWEVTKQFQHWEEVVSALRGTVCVDEEDVTKSCALLEKVEGVCVVGFGEDDYPDTLLSIEQFPPVLFLKGRWERMNMVAVVGSRRCSTYGRKMAYDLGRGFAELGIGVVSGMARGIDRWAHIGCLDAGGYTVAVWGTGIDRVYPREHKSLANRIFREGLVLTEFPPGISPLQFVFPRRNRLISGLASCVIVVEASLKSGSLITARWAAEQGKDVFVIPGDVTRDTAEGIVELLKNGASPVACALDVVQTMGWGTVGDVKQGVDTVDLDDDERTVWDLLVDGPVLVDEVLMDTGWSFGHTSSVLLSMELKGLIRQLPGNRIVRV